MRHVRLISSSSIATASVAVAALLVTPACESGGKKNGADSGSDSDSDSDSDGGDGDDIILGDGDGELGPGKVRGCNDLQVEFETVIPTVMLVVDRSSSMFDLPLAPFPNRWEPLKDALVGPDGAVTDLQGGIRFGFAAYTNQAGVGTCPQFDPTGIGLGNYDAIKARYDEVSSDPILTGVKGETPTGAAILAATAHLAAFTEPGPKSILLVTDGEPDRCSEPDPQCGQDEAIAAVQAAYAQGIGTFAIGVGEIGVNHLQDLANAGLGQPVQSRPEPVDCPMGSFTQGTYSATGGAAKVFNPTDPAALKADIAGIVGALRSCAYTLSAEVNPNTANLGTVLINGQTAEFENENGWRMNGPYELEILGASCLAVKTVVNPDVYISFPCNSFVK